MAGNGFGHIFRTTSWGESHGPAVVLTFSGEAAIRLETSGLLCHLEDLGESWPTSWQPEHPGD